MNLLEELTNANGGQNVEALAERFGLSGAQAQNVLSQLVPALGQGIQNNVSQQGGLDSLLGALGSGNHSRYVDDPSTLDAPAAVDEGNGILGHIFGTKDVSRGVAQHVAGNTGISDTLIKQMLPVIASMAMGAMSKRVSGDARVAENPQAGIASMLDFNGNGSVVDDVMGLMGKFFRN